MTVLTDSSFSPEELNVSLFTSPSLQNYSSVPLGSILLLAQLSVPGIPGQKRPAGPGQGNRRPRGPLTGTWVSQLGKLFMMFPQV